MKLKFIKIYLKKEKDKDYDAILVTNNEEHFKRIKGLKYENWLKG